ncbi:DUF3501 family protein [Vulcanisaeta thermophila]|uniref:DUF3501 family protein n=1 Tax=Vulcanisaeta thermophila TaxID=867917 RepID=UPI0008539355|nr:DUF3501 family protein [Vulcanisaeta thermophila]
MSTNELIKIINRLYKPSEYAGIRERAYSLIANYKASRYVKVDDRVTVLFEDAATVWFQIEETVFLEGTDDVNVLQEAVKTYSPMIPSRDELSITLFIYLYNYEELRNLLPKYNGVQDTVTVSIGNVSLKARPIYPGDYGPGAQPRSIHYLKVSHAGLRDLLRTVNSITLSVGHPMVNKSVEIKGDVLESLRSSITREDVDWVIR